MSKKSRNSGRFPDVNPGMNLLAVVALLLAFVLLGLMGYTLVVKGFMLEVRRVQSDLVNEKARQVADDISASIQANIELSIAQPTLGVETQRALKKQIDQNDDIVLIMTENDSGVIELMRLGKKPEYEQAIISLGGSRTLTAEGLRQYISQAFPNLLLVKFKIDSGFFANRTFYVWFENEVQKTIDRATQDFYSKLVFAIISFELIAILIYLIFRRQRLIQRRLLAERDHAKQMAYIGTLASGLAHEIRNPINAMAMQLEMLEEDIGHESADQIGRRVHRVHDGLVGLERSVQDFLNYARPGEQKPKTIELEDFLPEILDEFRAEHPSDQLQIDLRVAPGLTVWCDVHALRQIVHNVITNAIRAQKHLPTPWRISIEVLRSGHEVVVSFADAGPGVPADKRDKIFECFFTTHSEGSGLGLAIVQRLLEMNHGHIELQEDPSDLGGACFKIFLPIDEK